MGFNSFDGFMFSFIPIFMVVIPILVIGTFVFVIVKGLSQWTKNNNSPRLSVPSQVVTKRSQTSGGSADSSASTWYYVTFQVESGDRVELGVKDSEYGMLVEGDFGILTFQGTRYLGFERK